MKNTESSLRGSNVLVTGGFGFIGSAVVRALHSHGAFVRVLDNLSVGGPSDIQLPSIPITTPSCNWSGEAVEFLIGDILNDADAASAATGADAIIHLAANTGVPLAIENPLKDCLNNVVGTVTM